jgi:Fe-S-cluster-containing dehydrogenase component
MEHAVPVGIKWTKVGEVGPIGTYPDDLKQYYFPRACMQCVAPACVAACPTGASYQREDGLVLVDPEVCVGCETCIEACPYDARNIDPVTLKAVKCTMCVELIDKGEQPNCVHHCMGYARIYGDLEDSSNAIDEYLNQAGNNNRSFKLFESSSGTGPTVTYLEPKVGMLGEKI